MGTTDDDRNMELALDCDGKLLDGVMNAGERRKGDQTRVVSLNGSNEIGSVRDEKQIGIVTIGFQDSREICNADGFLDAVVLDEQRFHVALPRYRSSA